MPRGGYKITKKTMYINPDGEYTEKKEEVVAAYNDKGYLYRNRSEFYKTFLDNPYPEELSWADKGRLGRLEHELCTDQILAYKSGNEVKPHTATTISELLGYDIKLTRAFLKKCKSLGVIREAKINKTKYYLLNPKYKLRGNRISLTTFIVFKELLKKDLPQWAYDKFIEDCGVNNINRNIKIIE